MRTILYVLAVWFLISVPLACFIGRLCRLGGVLPHRVDSCMPLDEPTDAPRRVWPGQQRCGEVLAQS